MLENWALSDLYDLYITLKASGIACRYPNVWAKACLCVTLPPPLNAAMCISAVLAIIIIALEVMLIPKDVGDSTELIKPSVQALIQLRSPIWSNTASDISSDLAISSMCSSILFQPFLSISLNSWSTSMVSSPLGPFLAILTTFKALPISPICTFAYWFKAKELAITFLYWSLVIPLPPFLKANADLPALTTRSFKEALINAKVTASADKSFIFAPARAIPAWENSLSLVALSKESLHEPALAVASSTTAFALAMITSMSATVTTLSRTGVKDFSKTVAATLGSAFFANASLNWSCAFLGIVKSLSKPMSAFSFGVSSLPTGFLAVFSNWFMSSSTTALVPFCLFSNLTLALPSLMLTTLPMLSLSAALTVDPIVIGSCSRISSVASSLENLLRW